MNFDDPTVLGIETSGKTASCAVFKNGTVVSENTFLTRLTHSQVILPTLKRTLEDCETDIRDIDLFAVAAGPGSYTGLRIGIAAIKGICESGKPCIGVSTLEALAFGALAAKGLIIPALSARQGVSYFGAYLSDGVSLKKYRDDSVGEELGIKSLAEGFDGDVILTGDCAERLKSELFKDNERVRVSPLNHRLQSASGVCMAALSHLDEATDAAGLKARYLQNTMAEKLKDRGEAP